MNNSFFIGQTINQLLSDDAELTAMVEDKIYPIVAKEGTTYPFIVYKRLTTQSNGTKDGYHDNSVTFNIIALSTTYAQSINIAHRIRCILEKENISTEKMDMFDTHIIAASEDYNDGAYIQNITFSTHIN